MSTRIDRFWNVTKVLVGTVMEVSLCLTEWVASDCSVVWEHLVVGNHLCGQFNCRGTSIAAKFEYISQHGASNKSCCLSSNGMEFLTQPGKQQSRSPQVCYIQENKEETADSAIGASVMGCEDDDTTRSKNNYLYAKK